MNRCKNNFPSKICQKEFECIFIRQKFVEDSRRTSDRLENSIKIVKRIVVPVTNNKRKKY